MKKNVIIILSGGFSAEAPVSKITSAAIDHSLQNSGFQTIVLDPVIFGSYTALSIKIKELEPLIVFNGLHGTDGEDGRIQALLELEKIPYTGSDSRSSAIAMDKEISGFIARQIGLKIPHRVCLKSEEELSWNILKDQFELPVVIKPNDSGSSVGITIVEVQQDLMPAFFEAKKFSDRVILEEFIKGRELTVTMLDGKALPVVEIRPKNGWYDYANKYTKGNTIYEAPAKLETSLIEVIQDQAKRIFDTIGCSVYGRVDFRYDGKDFYFLEVNTLPGMTELSLTPMAAESAGIDFDHLLQKIIDSSLKRFYKDSKRRAL